MRTYRIPLLLWFFMAFVVAMLPALIFAWPISGCIYVVAFFSVAARQDKPVNFRKYSPKHFVLQGQLCACFFHFKIILTSVI